MSVILKFSIHERLIAEIQKQCPQWTDNPESICFLDAPPNGKFIRDQIILSLSKEIKTVSITIPSIRELFRGNRTPPEFTDYPEDYLPFFVDIETAVVREVRNHALPPPTDDDFIEVYSAMRRRPDGRSIGLLHDIIWKQTMVFLLTHECSQAEYEACIQKLERGARKFHFNWSTRNYFDWLLKNFKE